MSDSKDMVSESVSVCVCVCVSVRVWHFDFIVR